MTLHHSWADGSPHPLEACAMYDAVRTGATTRVGDDVFWRRDGTSLPVSYVSAPIDRGGDEAGVVCVFTDISERKRTEAERDQLLKRVESMARTDQLTGLANRRAWDEELQRELSRSVRLGTPLTVGLLDLDRFKAYNDTHGHVAGDVLLRETAAAWHGAIRGSDFVARYGGEEFGVLLPDCPADVAEAALERLRRLVPGSQTCSAGAATWDGIEDADELTARADAGLYRAKAAGRDQIVVS
jgi:diguanylate cyclase (GGDEF)-like protein